MPKFEECDKSSKGPMSPEKINEHEHTAVEKNPNDRRIVEKGETGVDSPEAKEKLRRSGMTRT
jgi:hypothetical protein